MTAQESYLSAVSRAMDCSSSTKHRLLDGLRQELSDTDADFEALCAQYGAPEDTARELMECVDPDELKKKKTKQKNSSRFGVRCSSDRLRHTVCILPARQRGYQRRFLYRNRRNHL